MFKKVEKQLHRLRMRKRRPNINKIWTTLVYQRIQKSKKDVWKTDHAEMCYA
jgi:hypothetical protein